MSLKKTAKKIIPCFFLKFYHYLLAVGGTFFYGFPSRKIKIIGITGTSGKSTTVDLTTRILEKAGYKVASLSSIKFKIGEREWENKLKMTMPGRFKIQKFLSRAVKERCQYLVLEVTSEGINQFRHKFINFEAAVFTNLSPEHIESHKGFKNYRKAKLKFFEAVKNIHVINLDDKNVNYFLKIPAKEKYGYRIKKEKPKNNKFFTGGKKIREQNLKIIEAENPIINVKKIKFEVRGVPFFLNLLGGFNIYNALAAICVGLSQEISLETCRFALEKTKGIPGRMEIVIRKPFAVIVDYAHTPEQLEKVYKTLRNPKSQISMTDQTLSFNDQNSNLICVLGSCGGGRDKWKRPVLGKLAARYCDKIIITNEDPYDEDPAKIIEQVAEGAEEKAEKIPDRKKAIKKALEMAESGDVVIITGKGSEPWMCLKNGKKIPWDDRKIVKEFAGREN